MVGALLPCGTQQGLQQIGVGTAQLRGVRCLQPASRTVSRWCVGQPLWVPAGPCSSSALFAANSSASQRQQIAKRFVAWPARATASGDPERTGDGQQLGRPSSSQPGGIPEWPPGGRPPTTVRVRVSVHYRVHSRQMLCVGGSEMPFGWSFLSIAKVPMIWSPGDIWTAEVELPAGTRIEYKYVILEEQDWTKQENVDAEGVATFTYRTEPDVPPDYQTIQKKMAIVAWQPGPNRSVEVPSEDELQSLQPGEARPRELPPQPAPRPPTPPRQQLPQRPQGSARDGRTAAPQWPWSSFPNGKAHLGDSRSGGGGVDEPQIGDAGGEEWELLSMGEDGVPVLERRDQWIGGAGGARPRSSSSNNTPPRRTGGGGSSFYFGP